MAAAAATKQAPRPGTAAPVLSVQNLEAWYGESHILHGIDFNVSAGEVVTLLGRNGAGKTTTLKSVMGIIGKRTGAIRFNEQEISRASSDRIARMGVAFCPEERGIFASLESAKICCCRRSCARAGCRWIQIFELFPNLKERLNSQGTKLSGGEQQMLAIARILRTGRAVSDAGRADRRAGPGHHPADRPYHRAPQEGGFYDPLVEQNFRFAATVADRYYIVEHGKVIDGFANSDLQANMDKLHTYLGV
jgi:branched-chain amino acid transport system ATP-binding protein